MDSGYGVGALPPDDDGDNDRCDRDDPGESGDGYVADREGDIYPDRITHWRNRKGQFVNTPAGSGN